ncbi:6-carboxytetrahydropterin synthase [Paracrocinitomix mangrovi]|uniref:6-pyruvoyl trahydropterin synthase family protein n=1 Tax=Paracrocinitomix mangrovi TaxID=2862509 RepID=UPI001C8EA74E|nr:6-carboxytetrahydropterin synthase [Paracrocinitomix mangrovi]UKN01480.1 6-carboxytetrahydropterin synthase [Paracrocinitomix mangrovi]
MKLRVSKIFDFETAHALWGYDGKCANIHGHTYVLTVTISGDLIDDKDHPKYGMIIDFGDIKTIVKKEIVDVYDHCLLIRKNTPHEKYADVETAFKKVWCTEFQPTCENMLIDMVERLQKALPDNIELKYVKLQETRSSYAEWFAGDN